jgi:hypothetical protein
MLKTLIFASAILGCSLAFGAPRHHPIHRHYVKHHHRAKRDRSTHHAAMHAEHWLDHHVSAPHKHGG